MAPRFLMPDAFRQLGWLTPQARLLFADGMHFGLIADRELVPDVDRMAGYLADELDELKKALAEA